MKYYSVTSRAPVSFGHATIYGHTAKTRKLHQVCCRLVTFLSSSPISGCVRIACSGLMITSVLQFLNRHDASWLSRFFIHKLDASCFNLSAASLQISSYNKSDFHRLAATWWIRQTCGNLLTTCNKPVKSTTCSTVCWVSGCVVAKSLVRDLLY